MAANPLDVRIARLEGAYEQVDRRLAAIEENVGDLREEVRGLRTEFRNELMGTRSELLARMDHQFFWTLGLLIVSILVPIALRVLRA